jgi:hypothetical protein
VVDEKRNNDQRRVLCDEAREAAWRTFLEYGFPGWLHDAFPISHGLSLTKATWDRFSGMFDEIVAGRKKKEQKRHDFSLMWANLLCAASSNRGPSALKVSMDNNNRWFNLVRELHRRGIIEMKIGFKNHETGYGRNTRIWLEPEWISEMFGPGLGALEDLVDWAPPELVQLREKLSEEDRKKGKRPRPIPYIETAFTRELRRKLRFINRANRTHRVECPDRSKQNSLLVTDLFAVFHNASWREGGRLYTSGWFGYQRLSEEERARILIDGEPTCELDFSGLHPRLLYAKEGIQYPCDTDPYKAVFECLKLKWTDTIVDGKDEKKMLRDVLKDVLLAVLNSETETMAERAGNHMRHLDHEVHKLLKRKGLSVRQVLDALKEVHKPIAKYFFSAAGLKIMRQDSMIALHVLTHFAKKGIGCLAIHDSFIVVEKYRDELRQIMASAYRKHANGSECPIK